MFSYLNTATFSLVEFLCSFNENYPELSEKATLNKILLFFPITYL